MLRDYQAKAIEEIRKQFISGNKKVLLRSATGSGKTVIFTHMMREAVLRGKRCVMIVRGRSIVDQTHKRLIKEKTHHGVYMANHHGRNPNAPIQICSVDTLTARQNFPPADLVVIDEAHMAVSEQYKKVISHYEKSFIVAVTATPYGKESLRHLADVCVSAISTNELMNQGYLIRPRYFAPSAPDLRGVKTVAGDFANSQLFDRMSGLSGDIVGTYKDLGENRPSMLFAVNINHSKQLCYEFNQAGIKAEHIDAEHDTKERQEAIARLENGEIKVICSVGTMTTGVDIPKVSCLIMARPTKSYNLFIQSAGRGTRPVYPDGADLSTIESRLDAIQNSDKKDFIILDHAGNVTRHGFITDEPEVNLDGETKKPNIKSPRTCKKCFLVFNGIVCPSCGTLPDRKDREIDIDREKELVELKDMPLAQEIVIFVNKHKAIAKKCGYKRGWLYHKVKDAYGEEVANELYPKRTKPLPSWLK
jgi:superfamily II DNA or RNA helicase